MPLIQTALSLTSASTHPKYWLLCPVIKATSLLHVWYNPYAANESGACLIRVVQTNSSLVRPRRPLELTDWMKMEITTS